MDENAIVEKILKTIEDMYGYVPTVSKVLSQHPDLFIPYSRMSGAIMEGKSELDGKTKYLIAMAAATALGSEHCVEVQMDHAIHAGATKKEIMEAMFIASYMSMTRSQSYAFRKYSERFDESE